MKLRRWRGTLTDRKFLQFASWMCVKCIVVIPDQRCSIGEKIRRLAVLVNDLTAEEMIDRMEFL